MELYKSKVPGSLYKGNEELPGNESFRVSLDDSTDSVWTTLGRTPILRWAVLGACVVVFFMAPVILLQSVQWPKYSTLRLTTAPPVCTDQCSLSLVESLPEGINLTATHPSTYDTWKNLINMAQHSIEITSFYWTLRSSEVYPHPSSWQGEDVFQALLEAGTTRSLKVRIVQSLAAVTAPNIDTQMLVAQGAADVRDVDVKRLMGSGVLHTKMWLVDRKHVYVGSANMDWRSLTQVKELGAVIYDCPCLAADMAKLFDVYWALGAPGATIPTHWPPALSTRYNIDTPLELPLNQSEGSVYIASSPPPFCPDGRTSDIDAIVDTIQTADKFIYIAVMDYFPLEIYMKRPKYWGVIDEALRTAAFDKKVNVRLMASHWNHTRPSLAYFLKSLSDLTGSYPNVKVETRFFEVPATPDQAKIPFGRVNHNKYMVTDKVAYIGTSNWSGDYFVNTAGIGLIVREPNVRGQLEDVFLRDWNSPYAKSPYAKQV